MGTDSLPLPTSFWAAAVIARNWIPAAAATARTRLRAIASRAESLQIVN
jgi:hypothetical protein